jgi:hypothetical protein
MIAGEVMDYKAHQMAQMQLGGLPKPKETLVGVTHDQVSHVGQEPRDDAGGAMDLDEELQKREQMNQ